MKITNNTKFKKGDRLGSAEVKSTLLVQEVRKNGVVFLNEQSGVSQFLPTLVIGSRLRAFEKIKAKPVLKTKNQTAEAPEKTGAILNPDHYRQGAIQPWDFILSQKMDFLEGNIIKYVTRYKSKNGVEDLQKAKVYLEKLIEQKSPKK